jgi:hypothetical protein
MIFVLVMKYVLCEVGTEVKYTIRMNVSCNRVCVGPSSQVRAFATFLFYLLQEIKVFMWSRMAQHSCIAQKSFNRFKSSNGGRTDGRARARAHTHTHVAGRFKGICFFLSTQANQLKYRKGLAQSVRKVLMLPIPHRQVQAFCHARNSSLKCILHTAIHAQGKSLTHHRMGMYDEQRHLPAT